MQAMISVQLDQTALLIQQTTMIVIVLANTGPDPLEDLNPDNYDGWPTLLLTDLTTGGTQAFDVPRAPRSDQPPINLAVGDKQSSSIDLNSTIKFPRPGLYELRAKAVWEGGEVVSKPVKLTIEPGTPTSVHLTNVYGSLTPLYLGVWLNGASGGGEDMNLVLSDIRLSSDTGGRVRSVPVTALSQKLASVPEGTQPYLSIPPNRPPEVQWIAWLQSKGEDQFIRYLLRHEGDVSDIEQGDLKVPGAVVVPPLLLHRASPKDKLPGAMALLHVPVAGKPGGRLHAVEIGPKGAKETPLDVELPPTALLSGMSACRANGDRRTFFYTHVDGGQTVLHVMPWSERKLPGDMQELHGWDLTFVTAGLTTTQEDHIRGLAIGVTNHAHTRTYSLMPWVYAANDELVTADPIPIQLPPEAEIIKAIPRINQNGAPYVAMCVKGAPYSWCFCKHDGSVVPLPTESSDPRLLVDVIFKAGELPIVMYVDPGRGFQFVEPG